MSDEMKLPPQFKSGLMLYKLTDGSFGTQMAGDKMTAIEMETMLMMALGGLRRDWIGEVVIHKLKSFFGDNLQVGKLEVKHDEDED